MQLSHIFVVFDSKAALYLQPFHTMNEATAVRSFTAAISDPSHEFNKHAEDFSLFYVGTFDAEKALYDTFPPTHVVSAHVIKAQLTS